jgi:argininosuccinate lyase
MAIERRVIELAGDVGAKLHTARSRNDQVATTFRLFTLNAVAQVAAASLALIDVLVEIGERNDDVYLPGYTHLQRAQPVRLSHHLNAHAWALLRDVDRLLDARDRMNVSPLGAGALAGSSLPIDPSFVADVLGFEAAFTNSLDAVSDRDFVAETLFDIALLGVHLSRMGEELVLWTTTEFNFAVLSDEYATGSSMLPQKKNSDVAELARAKSGRLVGNLTGLLVTLKGLPLSYNRDLQEDKEPLFDSYRQVMMVLVALAGAYGSMTFNNEVAATAADDPFMVAIDIAEELVSEGVPFRQAHEQVGQLVGEAVRTGRSLSDVVDEHSDFKRFADLFGPGVALARRRSPGSSGPQSAGAQQQLLTSARARAAGRLAEGTKDVAENVAGPFL